MGFASEYLWFWVSSVVCFICYGTIVWRWLRDAQREASCTGQNVDPSVVHDAAVMAWYPVGEFQLNAMPSHAFARSAIMLMTYN